MRARLLPTLIKRVGRTATLVPGDLTDPPTVERADRWR
jgi:hypothetical protein